MTTFYFWGFVAMLMVPVVWMLIRPEKAYEFPFFMAAAFGIFILPQAFSLRLFPGGVSGQSVADVLLMSILCLAACMLGYRLAPNRLVVQHAATPLNPNRLFHVGVVFVGVGFFFSNLFDRTDVQFAETGGVTGTGTILLFFQGLAFPGFAICLMTALRRPTVVNIGASLVGMILPIQTAVAGRREPAVMLGMIVMLGLYYGRGFKPPRWLVPVAMVVAMLAIPATGTYRGLHAEKNWEEIRQMDLVGNFKEFVTQESILELRNGAALIEATKATGNYEWGAGYWNHLVFRFVPAQLLGAEFKESLKLRTQWDLMETSATQTGFEISRGSTITGMGDTFQQFGWFGCLFFVLMAVLFRSLWVASLRPNAFFAQLLYISLCTVAMRAVTHWTLDFLPGLLYNVVFLGLGLLYARVPAKQLRPARPGRRVRRGRSRAVKESANAVDHPV